MDLVCELKDLKSHAQMMYMAGVLIGSVLFGILSDMYVFSSTDLSCSIYCFVVILSVDFVCAMIKLGLI